MKDDRNIYHRTGNPGGPGCPLATLPVSIRGADGHEQPSLLLDAGSAGTELEMLRTIVETLGVKWGKDDLGWWAVMPRDM